MKLNSEDPRLTAWVLGELPAAEAEEVARAVAGDAELQAEVRAIRETCSLLDAALPVPALRQEQREAVLRAGRAVVPFPQPVAVAPRKKSRGSRHALLAVAAVAVFGVFITFKPEPGVTRSAGTGAPAPEASLQPYPGPRVVPVIRPAADLRAAKDQQVRRLEESRDDALAGLSVELPDAGRLPATSPLPAPVAAAEIELPLLVGRASYDWVRGWIHEKNQLPPRDAVRIEELANAFPMPAEAETERFAGLRVACVAMNSLWSGPGRLVGVQISNESEQAKEVTWAFRPGSRDAGVRVLASTGGDSATSSTLPAGRRTLVLIELASAAGDAGDLVVSTGGRSRRIPAAESGSQAAGLQQAALVAAFGIWLRGEGIDDGRLKEILAAVPESADPRAAEARQLVGRALEIAATRR